MHAHAGRYVGKVDALALHVELPTVIDAAQAAFLVPAVIEIGSAMRAAPVEQADPALGVAEQY